MVVVLEYLAANEAAFVNCLKTSLYVIVASTHYIDRTTTLLTVHSV